MPLTDVDADVFGATRISPAAFAPDTRRTAGRRVCLVTTEFHGLFRNGGIGTANTGLAMALADAGFDVTVLFANADEYGPRVTTGDFTQLVGHYSRRGITLDYVRPSAPRAFDDPRSASHCVFRHLLNEHFDVVLFNDNGGLGYYALLAKYTGVFPDPPAMLVVTHGPISWVHEINAQRNPNRETLAAMAMERACAERADILISPSHYLIDWMTARGWTLPRGTAVIQNIVGVRNADAQPDRTTSDIKEIVFFGRQEVRKGLFLFCDALEHLQRSVDLAGVTVTFLGKFAHVGELHSGVYIVERTRSWQASVRLATDLGQEDALAYLQRPGVIAVVPSLAENSPCVVMECVLLGVPFLATDSGGTAELVSPPDRSACLFPPDPVILAARLAALLQHGSRAARPAISPAETLTAWLKLLDEVIAAPFAAPADSAGAADQPLVSVCLAHTASSPCSLACLASVMRQTYQRIEIIISRDADAPELTLDPADSRFPVRIIQTGAASAGVARNEAAARADGAYVLFVDAATAVLLPDCVQTLVKAAAGSAADILTGLPALAGSLPPRGADLSWHFPVSGCKELGALENCFGSGVVFTAMAACRDAIRYTTGAPDAVFDWLFLATAVIRGYRHLVVPASLFRLRPTGRSWTDLSAAVRNHRHILHAYRTEPLGDFTRILEMATAFGFVGDLGGDLGGDRIPQGFSPEARQLAHRLALMEPSSREADKLFFAYCCERRLTMLAVDFASLNRDLPQQDVAVMLIKATETAALDAIRRRWVEFRHDVDVTAEVLARARPMLPLTKADLWNEPSQAAIVQRIGFDPGMIQAAGVCPPGTHRMRVTVMPGAGEHDGVEIAIAVCRRRAKLTLSDDQPLNQPGTAFSGWLSVASPEAHVVCIASLLEPADDVADLYLLSRWSGNGPCPAATIVWSQIVAEVSVAGGEATSAIEQGNLFQPVPREVVEQGILLTDVSEFPFPVFVPGERTLLHPVPRKTALVCLPGALPAGAFGFQAIVTVTDERAHPVDFGIWIRPPDPDGPSEPALSETEGFSGWLSVRQPLVHHRLSLVLPEPATQALDVYLATRVSDHADVHFCHAYWNSLCSIEGFTPGAVSGD